MLLEAYEGPVIIGKPQDEHCLLPCDYLSAKCSTFLVFLQQPRNQGPLGADL